MRKKELYDKVITYFQNAMPVAETELHYNNPFELLIAVILSAQSGFPYTGSPGSLYAGSHLRIHPQCELS